MERQETRWDERMLPLLGGPFHGERYLATVPPPDALWLVAGDAAGDRYLLRAIAGGSRAAYVFEPLDADSASTWLAAWREAACDLPGPWQLQALRARGMLAPRDTCAACGSRGHCYAAQPREQPASMALHCLECGHLLAALVVFPVSRGNPQEPR